MADYRKHLIVGKKISVKVHINAKRSCGFHSSCQVTSSQEAFCGLKCIMNKFFKVIQPTEAIS